MSDWIYNGKRYPALPDWVKDYAIVAIVDPNLGDAYIIAAKGYTIESSWNITYGTHHTTYCVDGVRSRLENGEWQEPYVQDGDWLWSNSPYLNDGSTYPFWSNTDLVCKNDDGVEYVGLAGSNPVDSETGKEINPFAKSIDPTSMLMGWLVGRAIASQRKKQPTPPVEPDEPSVDSGMYLYGTQSESGNIGLQNGESVTLYDGAVLPPMPETDLPYAYIVSNFGTTYLVFADAPLNFRYINSFGYMLSSMTDGVYTNCNYERYELRDSVWGNLSTGNYYYVLGTHEKETIWSNTDLYHYDKDTDEATLVLSACSDPIPVGEIVDYNGEIPIYEVKT